MRPSLNFSIEFLSFHIIMNKAMSYYLINDRNSVFPFFFFFFNPQLFGIDHFIFCVCIFFHRFKKKQFKNLFPLSRIIHKLTNFPRINSGYVR